MYFGENNPWLGSIAHEHGVLIYPDAVDLELSAKVTGLRLKPIAEQEDG